ncbi:MAG: hypothetical protein AB7Q97_01775 [Gammaproteobacteria bacterium]
MTPDTDDWNGTERRTHAWHDRKEMAWYCLVMLTALLAYLMLHADTNIASAVYELMNTIVIAMALNVVVFMGGKALVEGFQSMRGKK